MGRAQQVLRDHQVRQGGKAKQLRRVFSQPLVPRLATAEQVLDNMKRMLNPRADLRLGLLDLDQQILQRAFAHRLDLSAPDSHAPLYRLIFHLVALVHASIAERVLLMPVQQGMGL